MTFKVPLSDSSAVFSYAALQRLAIALAFCRDECSPHPLRQELEAWLLQMPQVGDGPLDKDGSGCRS